MKNYLGRPHIPDNEEERLAKLKSYYVLDAYEQSGTFQHVAIMAARIFEVPMAFVNFVDEQNILIKASVGFNEVSEVKREVGLCSLAILKDEVTVFENAKREPRFLTNPLVHGEFGLEFYAGAPLKTTDGFNIGVIAIADKKPREFSKDEEQLLAGLAACIIDELEERQALLASC
ncbi:hypothetical protein AAE02nite_10480 [Adhaeribacter aerolatus]|uniref:GAF domain-containing protein n=1 Tax=Adhaeribacter aerolatus TaxID=670289 RepID=A0A512AUK0_9BACT|nr:GAF domain-containing protein [Adhaeribacter aerolatus]GEO03384.1 hypothetical protein AAE02nite_10480 [Adhaeribacter aerolatus]